MTGPATPWQGFLIHADGQVEELDADGEIVDTWLATDLYDRLVLAGYPLHSDPDFSARFDGVVDLSVNPEDPDEVTVYTRGDGQHEHSMGTLSRLFLDWYEREVSA